MNASRTTLATPLPIVFEDREHSIFCINKPAALPTHAPGDGRLGAAELLSEQLGIELWPAHRLDQDTSGLLLLCGLKETLKKLTALFEAASVEKEYLLVTDRPIAHLQLPITRSSFVTKYRGRVVSWERGKPANCSTTLSLVRQLGQYSLLRASPTGGKLHQIRIHAKDLKIPILGDRAHSGSSHKRLMLHAHKIKLSIFEQQLSLCAAPEPSFEQLSITSGEV